ncbi:MAG TPA: ABC transporter ATP-binding protein [Rhizobiaceae bacterium]|nr:ABC transporter ATP-binding protein [Rhizobiaceae bacterium]
MANVVEVRNLHVKALTDAGREVEIIRGVDLDIADGEILALIGESGSGKTTIALTLMGYARPGCKITQGRICLGGQDVTAMSEKKRANLRGTQAAYVPQSAAAAFNPSQRIMDQVIEVVRIHGLMPAAKARRKAVDLFRALALPEPETIGQRYPHQVSGGQLQRLSAAMALIGDPRIMIFDEPTTALDVTTQIEVLRAFKSVMRSRGMAGVYVSHDLAVVAQIADRIMVLKNGEVQEVGTTEQIVTNPRHDYTKALIGAAHPTGVQAGATDAKPAVRPIIEVDKIVSGYGPAGTDGMPQVVALNDVSLQLQPGHNLGVIGESGSGKSTLARTIAGLLPQALGSVRLHGADLPREARHRTKEQLRKLQIVFQLADTALNPNRSVQSILSRPLRFYHGLRGSECDARVRELLDMVHLPARLMYRLPGELSGGQKQRVNLARALAAKPDVILCDEVTSALDTVVASAVLDLLRELQRELGLSYLFISHDLSTIEAICDQVMVMYRGKKVEEMPTSRMKEGAEHPYSRLLISSVPQLNTGWLDSLEQDPELVRAFANR